MCSSSTWDRWAWQRMADTEKVWMMSGWARQEVKALGLGGGRRLTGEKGALAIEGRLGLPGLGWKLSLSSGPSCPPCLFVLGRHLLLHSLEPVVPSSLHLHPKLIEEALWFSSVQFSHLVMSDSPRPNKSKPSAFSSSSPSSSRRMASIFQHWNGPENLRCCFSVPSLK